MKKLCKLFWDLFLRPLTEDEKADLRDYQM